MSERKDHYSYNSGKFSMDFIQHDDEGSKPVEYVQCAKFEPKKAQGPLARRCLHCGAHQEEHQEAPATKAKTSTASASSTSTPSTSTPSTSTPSKTSSSTEWKGIEGKHILLTGGAGYIGSHIAVELLENNAKVTIVDNLCNSSQVAVSRVSEITGKKLDFYKVDLCNEKDLEDMFKKCDKFDAVIHLAGLKSVGESTQQPVRYYENNVGSSINLLKCMERHGCFSLVFSSSATVYGSPKKLPIDEKAELKPANPYGKTKLMIEEILRDTAASSSKWQFSLLRYFNPMGAHPSGKIGEDPSGIPNNLVPFVTQVAIGTRPHLNVFGSDWETKDGTGVRDYLHVVDLAKGHLAALVHGVWGKTESNCVAYNLGTGQGYSVLEILRAMEKASGKKLAYKVGERRPGDVAEVYADPTKAEKELHWKAKFTLQEAIDDAWRWQKQNPKGYQGS